MSFFKNKLFLGMVFFSLVLFAAAPVINAASGAKGKGENLTPAERAERKAKREANKKAREERARKRAAQAKS